MNLLEVQKLLGYSTGPENKTDKEADITNVIQVPDQPQAQQQTIQQTVKMVQKDQSQPVAVNPVAQVPRVSQPMTVTPVAQVPQVSQPMTVTPGAQVLQVSQKQLQQQAIPAPAPVQQLPVQVAVPQQLQVQNQNFMVSVLQFYSQEEVVDTRLLKFGNTTQVI